MISLSSTRSLSRLGAIMNRCSRPQCPILHSQHTVGQHTLMEALRQHNNQLIVLPGTETSHLNLKIHDITPQDHRNSSTRQATTHNHSISSLQLSRVKDNLSHRPKTAAQMTSMPHPQSGRI